MNITFDFRQITGRIKPMHSVGQPPFIEVDYSYFSYLKDANIPFSRLHDVGGAYGRNQFVDIPNIFRDFNADETDPASYDFSFTDTLVSALMENDCQPIFRLGVTIENQQHIRALRIHPPADFQKWARICEHIVRHYNEGWANGFHYGIVYWEIWNEPDNGLPGQNEMWTGTNEQFFALYDTAAKHLKSCFGDSIKIGGGASSSFMAVFSDPKRFNVPERNDVNDFAFTPRAKHMLNFFFEFLDYIKAHGSPMDFFPWHSYDSVEEVEILADFLDRTLKEHDLGHIETQLNEWNNAPEKEMRGTSYAASHAVAMMCAMQNKNTDILCYYDARIGHSAFGGLFNPITYEPFCTYYAFYAFGQLYRLKNQVKCEWSEKGIYAVAAADGESCAALVTNVSGKDITLHTNLSCGMKGYFIDQEHFFTERPVDETQFVLKKNQVVLLKNF